MAEVRERLGRPTILVNSAGLDGFDPFLKITAEKWNRILAVNLTGTFDCCQAVVPDMIEEGWGRIVNISSSSAQGGQPLMTHYVAAKAGVIGFTKALALELGPQGITVNTIPPGFIDTPMLRASPSARGCSGRASSTTRRPRPVRRVGTPEDIAATCCLPRAATRPATSPGRSSASTAGGTPDAPDRPAAPEEWPPEMSDALAALRPEHPAPPLPRREGRPKALNALGTLARHPELARAFNTFNGHILFDSTLSPRQRELLSSGSPRSGRSDYEWAQHAVLAGDVGLDDGRGRPDRRRPRRRRVVAARSGHAPGRRRADRDGEVSDATWETLAAELDEQQLMDLVFTVGAYEVLAMAFRSFGIELDDDLRRK